MVRGSKPTNKFQVSRGRPLQYFCEWKVVPPMRMHKGKRVQENWVRKALVAATSQRYITKAKFHEYRLRFAYFLRQQELNNRPHMLIVDSHSSHLCNLPFYQVMKENNIHVFMIPSNTSPILQPLDLTPLLCSVDIGK